jgi:hypothetical protein
MWKTFCLGSSKNYFKEHSLFYYSRQGFGFVQLHFRNMRVAQQDSALALRNGKQGGFSQPGSGNSGGCFRPV